LVRFALTGGQIHDCTQALVLLEGLRPSAVLADRGYDTNAVIGHLRTASIEPVIPSYVHRTVQRPYDVQRYRHRDRNRIERLFCRLKQFRRIATRYDKLAERFASFVAVAAAVLWLR
jgi:transposase